MKLRLGFTYYLLAHVVDLPPEYNIVNHPDDLSATNSGGEMVPSLPTPAFRTSTTSFGEV